MLEVEPRSHLIILNSYIKCIKADINKTLLNLIKFNTEENDIPSICDPKNYIYLWVLKFPF